MKNVLIFFSIALILFTFSCKKNNYKNIYTIKNESTTFINLSLFIDGTPYDYEIADGASITIENTNDGSSYLELSDSAYIYFNNYEKLQVNSKYTGDYCPGLGTSGNPSWLRMGFYCPNFYEDISHIDNYTESYLYVFDTADYYHMSLDI